MDARIFFPVLTRFYLAVFITSCRAGLGVKVPDFPDESVVLNAAYRLPLCPVIAVNIGIAAEKVQTPCV